jgi:hypothetical protein
MGKPDTLSKATLISLCGGGFVAGVEDEHDDGHDQDCQTAEGHHFAVGVLLVGVGLGQFLPSRFEFIPC